MSATNKIAPFVIGDNDPIYSTIIDDVESKNIPWKIYTLRIFIVFLLCGLCAGLGSASFFLLNRAETDMFKMQYFDSASQVQLSIRRAFENKLLAAKLLSEAYTNYYNSSQTWPNATLLGFESIFKNSQRLVASRAISFNPIIKTNEQRRQWEQYAVESAPLLQAPANIYTGAAQTWKIVNGIYKRSANGTRVSDPSNPPLVPIWQITPIESNFRAIMYNLHSEPKRRIALDNLFQYNNPTMTDLIVIVQDSNLGIDRPSSILFYPVYANTETISDMVGTVSIVFSWDDLLIETLPNYIIGIDCVLSTTSTKYMMRILGGNVSIIGKEDLHDAKYEPMRVTSETFLHNDNMTLKSLLDPISYRIDLYPTLALESSYRTNYPFYACLSVVLIIVFTSIVFVVYDFLIQNEIDFFKASAENSSILINSFFPKFVRMHLFGTSKDEVRPSENTSNNISSLKTFLSPLSTPKKTKRRSFLSTSFLNAPKMRAPIAEHFENATVLFADIAGFTAWSARHQPVQVFHFLETLYKEFDRVTRLNQVFKVETIGDCYMAVTGVPDHDVNHATNMALFAIQMQHVFDSVIYRLEDDLGPEISRLQLRVGFHSGSLMAGVLRSEKARFQLFGDTVNTASRMESTGVPGKIQLSDITEALLDKSMLTSAIVIEREESVEAKGKGSMRTFWLLDKES